MPLILRKRSGLRLVLISPGLLFCSWLIWSSQARGLDETVFHTTPSLRVDRTDNWIAFISQKPQRATVLFFPGALVDPDAYAPLARHIAEAGYQFYLIKMPWRLASQGYQKINGLFNWADSSRQYILCGHSLGGKMAAQFVYENPGKAAGLILLGTSHPRDVDLSNFPIPILKLYATHDGLANPEEVLRNRDKLPVHTQFVRIEGGNHAQFGYYGFQLGDHSAEISRVEQQRQTVQSVVRFLGHF